MTVALDLTVVVPVFNEAGNAARLAVEIGEVLNSIGSSFEVLFVNDGSTDGTLEELRVLQTGNPWVRILDLDGNFGEAAALCAGFEASRGAVVITLDGDGQNDPRDIPLLLQALRSGNYRVVSGWRRERQEGYWLRVFPSRVANRLIALVTRVPMHDNGCGLKAYRREVLVGVCLPAGFHRFLPAILGVGAAEVTEVPVHDRRRQFGRSHYGMGRTLIVLRDLLTVPFVGGASKGAKWLGALLVTGAVCAGLGATRLSYASLAVAPGLVGLLAASICWNLRRFQRAQRHGVYRVRQEL